jgi:hypothetical protein
MSLQPGVLVIAGIIAFALTALPLGIPLWARLVALVTMPAWLGPIVIRFRHTQPRSAEFALTSLDGSGSPTGVRTTFDATRDALSTQGFVEVGRLRQTNGESALAGFVQLLENRDTFDVCSRLVVADAASGRTAADLAVFVTEPSVGPVIVTSNARTMTPFPPNPRFDTLWFPDLRDPAHLYAIHGARVSRPGRGLTRRTSVAGDPAAYQRHAEAASKEHMVRCGYWWLDEDARVYRPTWQGAILMTLRSLPPFRQLIRWRRARRAAAVARTIARRAP